MRKFVWLNSREKHKVRKVVECITSLERILTLDGTLGEDTTEPLPLIFKEMKFLKTWAEDLDVYIFLRFLVLRCHRSVPRKVGLRQGNHYFVQKVAALASGSVQSTDPIKSRLARSHARGSSKKKSLKTKRRRRVVWEEHSVDHVRSFTSKV